MGHVDPKFGINVYSSARARFSQNHAKGDFMQAQEIIKLTMKNTIVWLETWVRLAGKIVLQRSVIIERCFIN